MTVMNITACRIFEDEVINTICNDHRIENVIVVENEDRYGILNKLNAAGIDYEVKPVDEIPPRSILNETDNYTIIVNMLELSLHGEPKKLRDHVYSNVKTMARHSDGILLFYGLCGNVLRKIEKDFESFPCPVSILKDDSGKIVDDCIGVMVGGRKSFLNLMNSFNRTSTLLMTPMWIENWKEMFKHSGFIQDQNDIEMAKFVLDSMGYKTVVKLNTSPTYIKGFEDKVNEFARLFDLDVIEIEGNRDIIRNSYTQFRDEIFSRNNITLDPEIEYAESTYMTQNKVAATSMN